MRIPCPYCGERDVSEFAYRGDAAPVRPQGDDPGRLFDYVYLRDNCAGEIDEHWYHTMGCRNWLVVRRDTLTHWIAAAVLAAEARR